MELKNEYTKIVTAHLVWVNLGVINNDNAERISAFMIVLHQASL